SMILRSTSSLLPYTTLFRSCAPARSPRRSTEMASTSSRSRTTDAAAPTAITLSWKSRMLKCTPYGNTQRGTSGTSSPRTRSLKSYGAAITELKREGKLDRETAHRQVKYLNNVIEADHGKLKILIKPVRGFKSIPTAYATIKGFEVMRALRKGQARPWCLQPGIRGEVRLVERAFGIGPSALTEAMG